MNLVQHHRIIMGYLNILENLLRREGEDKVKGDRHREMKTLAHGCIASKQQ